MTQIADAPGGKREMESFWERLPGILPKLRTHVQLAGVTVGLAAYVAMHWAKPDQITAQICAGAIGAVILGLGSSFNVINQIEKRWRALFVIIIFGMSLVFILILLWLIFYTSRPPNTNNIKPAERRVEELSGKVGLIWGKVEGCLQTPSYVAEIRKDAPHYAEDLLRIEDSQLRRAFRVAKYSNAAFFWVSAATVQSPGPSEFCMDKKHLHWALQALKCVQETIDEIDQAKAVAAKGDQEAKMALTFTRQNEVESTIRFYRAVGLAIRMRCASTDEKPISQREFSECMADLSWNHDVFLERISLETNEHIRWCIEAIKGNTR